MKKSNRITIDDIRKNPILIDKVESGEVDLRTFTKDDLANLYKSNNESIPELENIQTAINQDLINDLGMEDLRQQAKKDKKKGIILGCLTGGIVLVIWILILHFFGPYLSFIGSDFLFGIIGLSVMASGALVIIHYSEKEEKYIAQYKSHIVKNILDSIFDNVVYIPDKGIPKEVIEDAKIIEMGSYESNDYIEASYNGVHFIQADINTYYDYDNGRETYFEGRWMIFDFNKTFKANIQVIPTKYKYAKKFKNFRSKDIAYKKVETEDVEFNKQFKVLAQNDYDVFYVLTPQMMERIKKLSNNISGDVILYFNNNLLHIGINNSINAFETDIDESIDVEMEKHKILYDVNLITLFIKELQLDMNLFK